MRIADVIAKGLAGYPVVNEEDWSTLEWEEAANYWEGLSPRAKVRAAMEARARYHWLSKEPVWRFGRMDCYTLANDGSQIARALYASLRS